MATQVLNADAGNGKRTLTPAEVNEYVLAHYERSPRSFVLKIRDNSMEADDIKEGDHVVCEPDEPCHPGVHIVVAKVFGQDEPVLGRYRLRDENGAPTIEILPSNSAWPPYVIDAAHPGKIIGPIVERRRNLVDRRRHL